MAPDFDTLVTRHRGELFSHCYRMLGSRHDAEDALQEALLAAWKGFDRFEGRASARSWLYTVTTNVCLRQSDKRPKRMLTTDFGPSFDQTADLGEPVMGPVWVEPLAGDPAEDYQQRTTLELAFIAALQHLPGTQRAVLVMREALGFSAAEVAEMLDTTPQSVNSALQRARATVEQRMPARSQADELDALGAEGQRELVERFVHAWENADLDGLVDLLTEDAVFTMPPLPAWFDGLERVRMFLAERLLRERWKLRPVTVNGQLGVAGYMWVEGAFRLGGVNALTVRDGRIAAINSFLDQASVRQFELTDEFA